MALYFEILTRQTVRCDYIWIFITKEPNTLNRLIFKSINDLILTSHLLLKCRVNWYGLHIFRICLCDVGSSVQNTMRLSGKTKVARLPLSWQSACMSILLAHMIHLKRLGWIWWLDKGNYYVIKVQPRTMNFFVRVNNENASLSFTSISLQRSFSTISEQ